MNIEQRMTGPTFRNVQSLETGGWYTDLFFTFDGQPYGTRLPYLAGAGDIAREKALFIQRRQKEANDA